MHLRDTLCNTPFYGYFTFCISNYFVLIIWLPPELIITTFSNLKPLFYEKENYVFYWRYFIFFRIVCGNAGIPG